MLLIVVLSNFLEHLSVNHNCNTQVSLKFFAYMNSSARPFRRGKWLGHWKHMTTIILTYCVEQISFSLIHPNNIGYSLLCERMWHLRGEPMHSQVRHWYQRSWLGLIVVTNWQSSLEFARLSVYTHQRRKERACTRNTPNWPNGCVPG